MTEIKAPQFSSAEQNEPVVKSPLNVRNKEVRGGDSYTAYTRWTLGVDVRISCVLTSWMGRLLLGSVTRGVQRADEQYTAIPDSGVGIITQAALESVL